MKKLVYISLYAGHLSVNLQSLPCKIRNIKSKTRQKGNFSVNLQSLPYKIHNIKSNIRSKYIFDNDFSLEKLMCIINTIVSNPHQRNVYDQLWVTHDV